MTPRPIVLVVEDQSDIAELVRLEFSLAGWTVHVCHSADEALPLALQLHPDVAIIDVMLPGYLDGFELCRRIKTHDSLAATSVVMLSALTGESHRTTARIAGADGYVGKPFLPSELARTVSELV